MPHTAPSPSAPSPAARRFARAAWAVLVYVLLVVLWGAFVRATGSGAGCGGHWPLCNGEVVPRSPTAETMIEYTHRLTSGLSLLAVALLCIWAFRLFPRGHRVRLMAILSLLFLLIEAALGAGLVLFGFVAQNASLSRAVYLSAHLTNTQVLLAMLALTAWFATHEAPSATKPRRLFAALAVALAVSVTGAVAALGDTLFPATSVAAGQQNLSETSRLLFRLRLVHPVTAAAGGCFLLLAALWALRAQPSPDAAVAARLVVLLVLVQLAAGVINILLLAPVWMQLLHLLLADLLWLALVVLFVTAPSPALRTV